MLILVGLINSVALVLWVLLMGFLWAAGGGRPWEPVTLALYCGPLAYFALSFVSVIPSVRAPGMLALGIVAHLALAPTVVVYIAHGPLGFFILLPLAGMSLLWMAAYRSKQRAQAAPEATA